MYIRLCLTGNEPRQKYVFAELEKIASVKMNISFDDIDPLTKYVAAGLSFSRPRSEWWENYHMHPLIQRRRRNVLLRGISGHMNELDALLMWGSWFQPFVDGRTVIPFFQYIDQSHSLENLPGEPKGRFARRQKAHALQTKTYQAAGAVFCMSQWARSQTLEAHDIPESKVIAVGWGPCGVNLSSETPKPELRERLVLHVSNDFHRKGVEYLIRTADRVAESMPGVRFLVVGRDTSGFIVPTDSRVEFTGPIYGDALAELFRKASVFFLPHKFDRSPHVLAEAMSAGLPLVASNQGGAIEVIDGRDNGILCKPGDVDAYAAAIISILSSNDLRDRMGANGLSLMREYYNWPVIARKMVEEMSRYVARSKN